MPIYCPLSEAVGIEPGEKSVLDFEDDNTIPYDQFIGLFGGENGSKFATERNHRLYAEGRHPAQQIRKCPHCGVRFRLHRFIDHKQRCLHSENSA